MARWRQPRGPRKAGLSKLGTLDREHTGAQIHVRQRELARFAEAQACDAQQAEQTVVRPWPQSTLARQRERRLEQASDLRVRVEIRARSGNRPAGGISVRGSVALRCRANPRTRLSRYAHSAGCTPLGCWAQVRANWVVITEARCCSMNVTKAGNALPALCSLNPKRRRNTR